jgi:hypothetical protein
MPRPQFRLPTLFIFTAVVAVGCLVGPPIIQEVRDRFRAPRYFEVSDLQIPAGYDRERDMRPTDSTKFRHRRPQNWQPPALGQQCTW